MRVLIKVLSLFLLCISFLFSQNVTNDIQKLRNGYLPENNGDYQNKLNTIAKVQNNRITWKTGTGTYLDRYICYGDAADPIKFTILIDRDVKDLKNIKLTLSVWDVDEDQGEVDVVSVNGYAVGILHGANDSWSVNNYTLTPNMLVGGTPQNPGVNEIVVDLTVSGWCVTVDWGAISADGDEFNVVSHTPLNKQTGVDFEKPDIKAVFNMEPDSKTINSNTFIVSYWDKNNMSVPISGSYSVDSKTNTVSFTPSSKLLDGVKYKVEIKGGTNGVKSTSGATMKNAKVFYFTTVPEITVEKVVPVQTAEGANMIAFKNGVVRVYAYIDVKQNVALNGQVDKIDNVDVKLEQPGYVIGTKKVTIKRKDKFTKRELTQGTFTINFFDWFPPAGGSSLTATIGVTSSSNTYREYKVTNTYTTLSKFKDLKYVVQPVLVGSWKTSPPASFPNLSFFNGSDVFTYQIFPVSSVSHSTLPALPISQPAYSPMDQQTYVFWELHNSRIRNSSTSDFIAGYTPSGWLGAIGYSSFLFGDVIAIDEVFWDVIPTHEFAHNSNYLGTGHTDGPLGSLQTWTIEGFKIYPGGSSGEQYSKKYGVFPAGVPLSFMNTDPPPNHLAWITNEDYNTLLNRLPKIGNGKNLEKTMLAEVMILGGYLSSSDNVILEPIQRQNYTVVNFSNSGSYSIEQLNSSNSVLATNNFNPSPEFTGKDGLKYRYFSEVVPYNAQTTKIRIKKGSTVLKEIVKSNNAPVVSITSPTTNAIWSGSRTITWTASDADKDTLYYDIKYSSDGGTNWILLARNYQGNSLNINTNTLTNSNNAVVSVTATDGFNCTTSTASFSVANGLTVISTLPQNNATNVSTKTAITFWLSSKIKSSDVTSSIFTLTQNMTTINGTLKYNNIDNSITFTPSADLTPGLNYVARLKAGLKDSLNNQLANDYVISFYVQNDSSLYVDSHSPQAFEQSVPVNSSITVYFSNSVNSSTINTTTFSVKENATGATVPGTVTYNSNTKSAVFTPTSSLKESTEYKVTLSSQIKSSLNKPLDSNYEFLFTTGSGTISNVQLLGSYSDMGIDDNSNGKYDWLAIDVDVNVKNAGTYSINGRLADKNNNEILWAATNNQSLTAGANKIRLKFDGKIINAYSTDGPYKLTDLQIYSTQNTEESDWISEAYTTKSYKASDFETSNIPVAINFTPSDGSTGVPTNVSITVTFTRNMNASKIDTNSFYIRTATGAKVPATVTYNSATRVATLTPKTPLQPNTSYTVTISSNITDEQGTKLLKQYNWTFMTGAGVSDETGAITNLVTYPNPFPHSSLPDGGTKFAFNLSDNGTKLRIMIYTVSGELVKEIETSQVRKGYNEIYWNGYNKENKPVSSGTYIYIIYFTDSSNKENKKIGKLSVLR
jgi:flagellar hook assembly protein FlgD